MAGSFAGDHRLIRSDREHGSGDQHAVDTSAENPSAEWSVIPFLAQSWKRPSAVEHAVQAGDDNVALSRGDQFGSNLTPCYNDPHAQRARQI